MARTVKFAASGVGSFWYAGGVMLKKAIAPLGFDLALDDKASDYNNVLSVASGKNLLGITMPAVRRLGAAAHRHFRRAADVPSCA